MPTLVEKVLTDGATETLHHNLPDGEAVDLARKVLAGNDPGSVKVRLTPFKWDDDNAEYVLDHDAAYELPRDVEEQDAEEKSSAKADSK